MPNAAPSISSGAPEAARSGNGLVLRLGVTPYREAWDLQRRLVAARQAGLISDVLILVQHPHTYTLGRRATAGHLLWDAAEMERRGVSSHWVDRGGDITYHGPGQIVGYPVLDIRARGFDIHQYLRAVEETLIRTLARLDVVAGRDPSYTGVWVGNQKIAAIGVRVSRGVTSHGFGFNVNTDLSYFDGIVPCGIADRSVTSLTQVLGAPQDLDTVGDLIVGAFAGVFGGTWSPTPLGPLIEKAPPVPPAVEEPRAAPVPRPLRSVTIEI